MKFICLLLALLCAGVCCAPVHAFFTLILKISITCRHTIIAVFPLRGIGSIYHGSGTIFVSMMDVQSFFYTFAR
jgi:hypothetical protein